MLVVMKIIGISEMIIQTDFKSLVEKTTRKDDESNNLDRTHKGYLIENIRKTLSCMGLGRIKFIPRQENIKAHLLAQKAIHQNNFIRLTEPNNKH